MKTPFTALTDAELADEFNKGTPKAFDEIYARYSFKLFLHARGMLRNELQAEDVVQDTFATLLERKGNFLFQDTISAYLYRSVSNRILKLFRAEKVKGRYLDDLAKKIPEAGTATDALVLEKELASIIDRHIEQLPAKMREIFELSRKQQFSHKQISQKVGSSEATVKKQVYYALKILRGKLSTVITLMALNVILWLSNNR